MQGYSLEELVAVCFADVVAVALNVWLAVNRQYSIVGCRDVFLVVQAKCREKCTVAVVGQRESVLRVLVLDGYITAI